MCCFLSLFALWSKSCLRYNYCITAISLYKLGSLMIHMNMSVAALVDYLIIDLTLIMLTLGQFYVCSSWRMGCFPTPSNNSEEAITMTYLCVIRQGIDLFSPLFSRGCVYLFIFLPCLFVSCLLRRCLLSFTLVLLSCLS